MMKKFIFCLIFITCLFPILLGEKVVISVPLVSIERVSEYIEQGFDIAQVFTQENEVHIVVTPEERQYFEAKYSQVRVVFTESEMRENLTSTHRDIPGYRTYNQMITQLLALQDQYPTMVEVTALGPTHGKLYYDAGNMNYSAFNHLVYSVKMSNNVSVYQDKPNYFFSGAIHAREPVSAEVVMTIIENLLETYSTTDDEHPLNQSQIWFVPVINPDGHHVVNSQMSTMHRKNIFDNNNNGQLDLDLYGSGNSLDGVDVNRNFDFYWGTTGVSFSFATQTYPGTHGFSSIEAAYMRDLAAEIPFIGAFTYHTHGHLVLWPYGYAYGGNSHNQATISSLGIELANLMPRFHNPNLKYTPQPSWELYPASGTTDDYYHFKHNTLAYTVELASQFIPTAAEVEFHKINQLPAAYLLMSRHKNRFLSGLVTDYLTGAPVRAEIRVFPIDEYYPEREPIFSDLNFGRYNYPLMPGQYQLFIRADGYYPYSSDITITATAQTVINVQLMPAEPFTKSFYLSHATIPDLFQNTQVILRHTREDVLMTNSQGYVSIDDVSPGDMTIIAKGTDLRTYITTVDIPLAPSMKNEGGDLAYDTHIIFDDFTFVDEFNSFAGNWNAQTNWTISSTDPYSGPNAVRVTTYTNQNAMTTMNPIQIPAGEKMIINFMAKYNVSMQSDIYIEFDISENNSTWTNLYQIRKTAGWENFQFEIPANKYNQLYFRFRVRRHATASPGAFNLDLFSVKVGDPEITPLYFNPPQNFVAEMEEGVVDMSWEAPVEGSFGDFSEYKIYRDGTVIHNTTDLSYTDTDVIIGARYEYYVTAFYVNPDRESAPSNIVILNDTLILPNPVALLSPEDNAVDVGLRPTFTWSLPNEGGQIDGLRFYLYPVSPTVSTTPLSVSTEYTLSQPQDTVSPEYILSPKITIQDDFIDLPANATSYTIPTRLDYETIYQWCVIPYNELGDAHENAVFSFTTEVYISIPSSVTLLTPTNNAEDIVLLPTFTWELPNDNSTIDGLKFYLGTEVGWLANPDFAFVALAADATEYTILDNLEYETEYFWSVIPFNQIGDALNNDVFSFITEEYTSEKDLLDYPMITELLGNHPNPFNPETVINYNLAEPTHVAIEIYNIRGQRVRNLLNTYMDRGFHSVIWNGTDDNNRSVGSGMYFYVMRTEDFSQVRRMVLLK